MEQIPSCPHSIPICWDCMREIDMRRAFVFAPPPTEPKLHPGVQRITMEFGVPLPVNPLHILDIPSLTTDLGL